MKVLGPIGFWVDGRRHSLGSLKERAILAILVLEADRSVPIEVLISRVWDDRPPAHARDNLISYVSRLRRRLKHATNGYVRIVSTPNAYQLVIDPEDIDLRQFQRLCSQADAIAQSGDGEHAVYLLREAEALWCGEALSGLPGDWMQRVREGLEEEHRALILDRIDGELRLGHHARVLGELRQLAARYPLDERIAAQLMTGLYRCDQQADALQIYRRLRALLGESLGTEPGARVQEVHQLILRRDLDLAITPQYRNPGHPGQPCTLPAELGDFIGRMGELAVLDGADHRPTAVIVGMPGVGKTALAILAAHRLAQRLPDAQIFLNLAAHNPGRAPLSPSEALSSLLRTIGIPASRIPSALGERAALWSAEMANRRAVIVLDDAVDEQQIRPLLPATNACHVLITARCKISGLPDTTQIPLDVLPTKDAISLFTRIANCVDGVDVEKAVRLCGQLPLAIRLVASRVRNGENIGDLVEELALEVPNLSADGIRAAFDLSYQELSPVHQEVSRRLAWHPGDHITENSAASLAGIPVAELRSVVATLLEHHLLEQVTDTSYRFHALVRLYLRDRSSAEDVSLTIRRTLKRLLNYYLSSADEVDRLLHPHRRRPVLSKHAEGALVESPEDAQRWFDSEWSGIVAMVQYAIDHEWHKEGAILAYLVSKTLEDRGSWEEASLALGIAFRSSREVDDRQGMARTALELSFLCFLGGDGAAALSHAGLALTVARRSGNNHGSADALDRMGIVHWSLGHYRAALAHCQEALRIYQEVCDYTGQATALNHIGISCWHLGRYDEAVRHVESALAIYRETGDSRGVATTLNNLGDVQQSRGYHRDALKLYQQSLAIFDDILGHHNHAILYSNIGNVHRYKGKFAEALESYRKALAIYRSTGDRRDAADTYNNIGMTYRLMERYSEALIHHEKASDIAAAIKNPYESVRALAGVAGTHRGMGGYSLALQKYNEALVLARRIGDLYQEAQIHDGIADVTLHVKDREAARIHWLQALDIFRSLNVPEAHEVEIRLEALDELAS